MINDERFHYQNQQILKNDYFIKNMIDRKDIKMVIIQLFLEYSLLLQTIEDRSLGGDL
jgi:hypothetical protein